MVGIFLLKVLCGVVFWYIYTFHYGDRDKADIYKYFDDSKIMFDALRTNTSDFLRMFFGFDSDPRFQREYYSHMHIWTPQFENTASIENHSMIRLNVIFRFFSLGYYQVHNIFINLLSFAGLLALYKTFEGYAVGKRKLLFLAICLLPGVLFWGSGVIRESFILFAMGFSVYYLHKLLTTNLRGAEFFFLFVFLFLLLLIKMVLCVLIVAAFVGWWMSIKIHKWPAGINFLTVFVVGFLAVVLLARTTSINYLKSLVTKQIDFVNTANGGVYLLKGNKMAYIPFDKKTELLTQMGDSLYKINPNSDYYYYNMPNSADTIFVKNATDTLVYKLFSSAEPARSTIRIPLLKATPFSFVMNAPLAFANVLTRPHPLEINSFIMFPAAAENLLILFFILLVLFRMDRNALNEPAFYFCISIVTSFYVLVGWITPILGVVVRYKIVVLPFLMIALVLLFSPPKKTEKKI